jgi:hypothetical protein
MMKNVIPVIIICDVDPIPEVCLQAKRDAIADVRSVNGCRVHDQNMTNLVWKRLRTLLSSERIVISEDGEANIRSEGLQIRFCDS